MKKKYSYIISFLFFRISWVAYAKETGIGCAVDIGKILAEPFNRLFLFFQTRIIEILAGRSHISIG